MYSVSGLLDSASVDRPAVRSRFGSIFSANRPVCVLKDLPNFEALRQKHVIVRPSHLDF